VVRHKQRLLAGASPLRWYAGLCRDEALLLSEVQVVVVLVAESRLLVTGGFPRDEVVVLKGVLCLEHSTGLVVQGSELDASGRRRGGRRCLLAN
jgi:hypothetical protein